MSFELSELSIDGLQRRIESGADSSRSLVEKYLGRIEEIDDQLGSVIELNPDAQAIAEEMDRERGAGKSRGPLHGIPVMVKDNIDSADKMKTTAGSLALADTPRPVEDAFVVKRLRAAGAVLLGKTNLSEWANIRSSRSTSGWSGRGGQQTTRMPSTATRAVQVPVPVLRYRRIFVPSRLVPKQMGRSSAPARVVASLESNLPLD